MTTPERVPNAVLIELDRQQRGVDTRKQEAERTKMAAAEAVALASMEVVRFLRELMHNDEVDIQARLRAADILMSRQIPKVAAKHASLSDEETVDTVDVQALRQSILAEVQKRR